MKPALFASLAPSMQEKTREFLLECEADGLDVLIYCARRSNAEQAALFCRGRWQSEIDDRMTLLSSTYGRDDLAALLVRRQPEPGPRCTNAGPGQSLHNYGLAFDGVPMLHGKPVWDTSDAGSRALWERYGRIAEAVGLEWAGKWHTFREMPHCQLAGADWRELIYAANV